MYKGKQQGHVLVIVLSILLIAGLAVTGWYVWSSNKSSPATANGARGSQQSKDPTESSRITNGERASADFLSYANKDVTADFVCAKLIIDKQLGDFVSANIAANDSNLDGTKPPAGSCGEAGGGIAVAYKKEDGKWSEIWRGQDHMSCDTVNKYGIPKELDSLFEQCLQDDRLVPNTNTTN